MIGACMIVAPADRAASTTLSELASMSVVSMTPFTASCRTPPSDVKSFCERWGRDDADSLEDPDRHLGRLGQQALDLVVDLEQGQRGAGHLEGRAVLVRDAIDATRCSVIA